MAATTHVNVRDAGSTQPLLSADEYDAYSWVLLEDHPLRSHPTECCPGVLWVLRKCCAAVNKRWSDRALTLICLFLMFLYVFYQLSTGMRLGLTNSLVEWRFNFSRFCHTASPIFSYTSSTKHNRDLFIGLRSLKASQLLVYPTTHELIQIPSSTPLRRAVLESRPISGYRTMTFL